MSSATAWSLVIPVKRLSHAKSRLADFAGTAREDLALALALDTVAAARGTKEVAAVVVVTDDPIAGQALGAAGVVIVPDVPNAGLNKALEYGAAAVVRKYPEHGLGALSADLPALRSTELSVALHAAAESRRAFVCDVSGVGTTLLTAQPGVPLAPAFGPRSRAKHRAAGAAELTMTEIPSLRRDVDTEVDLLDAERLGLGPATTAVLATIRAVARR
jgi:2-phospho-L-lactate/phosphoenolpyruvate guanylyltransferase